MSSTRNHVFAVKEKRFPLRLTFPKNFHGGESRGSDEIQGRFPPSSKLPFLRAGTRIVRMSAATASSSLLNLRDNDMLAGVGEIFSPVSIVQRPKRTRASISNKLCKFHLRSDGSAERSHVVGFLRHYRVCRVF